MDLYDQRDSNGQMPSISSKEGLPVDYLQLASNVQNQRPPILHQSLYNIQLHQAMKPGTFWTEYLCGYSCNSTRYQQFSNFSSIQSSFEMCLPLIQHALVEEATCIPLICYESVLWTKKQPSIFGSVVEGRLNCTIPSKDSYQAFNLLIIK
jgi:hypothetical protein